jgi:hypothetical protein
VAFIPTIGYPASTPLSRDSSNPFSTAGIYCLGTTPPTILSTNSNSVQDPAGVQIQSKHVRIVHDRLSAFLCLPSALYRFTDCFTIWYFWFVNTALTPNLFFKRLAITSRCTSPTPDIMVCPVSTFVLYRKGRIFLHQAGSIRTKYLFFFPFFFCSYRHGYGRFGEFYAFIHNR